ncbi:Protein HemY [Halioglobus japonicus]|nr:Protein HemY [Halioglobus japonicus]
MRKLFAIALVALLLGVGIVAIIKTDPGYVLMAYGNYTLEASLWIGLLLILLLVVLIFLILRLVYQVFSGQRTLVSWLGARKVNKAQRLSARGMISFIEGNWQVARRQLIQGAKHSEAPLQNYLMAARASAQLDDTDKVHEYLRSAGDADPAAAVAVEISLAEMKLQAGEYSQAIAALQNATANPGQHPYVLSLLCQAYQGMGDWKQLLELLPQLQKHKVLPSADFQQLEYQVYLHTLENGSANLEQLQGIWKKMPRHLQGNADLVALYVRALIALSDHSTAEKTILKVLKHEWQISLVRLYAYVQSDTAKQLAKAESWLEAHADEPQLLLCLGRLSSRDELWGKARDYFESAYRLEKSGEVCAELGRLLDALGEPTVAAAYYREGILLQEGDLPVLPKPDKFVHDPRVVASL